jgi:hypothetical protein
VVIDSNRVQSDELARFLASSPSNRAVVTDWLMMEAYKGQTLNSIYKSLGILARYPRQVIVLKNTGMCMKTRVGPQMSKRLIWREHTNTFPQWMREVQAAKEGDPFVKGSLLWRGDIANERMHQLEERATEIMDQHRHMMSALAPEDVDTIRGKWPPAPTTLVRVLSIANAVAEDFRGGLELEHPKPKGKDLTNDFLFRVGVAITCWFLEWVRTGSQAMIKPNKVRNDYVDAMLSVYGTYYNGIMTGDAKLHVIHAINRHLLKALGAQLPPPYVPPRL